MEKQKRRALASYSVFHIIIIAVCAGLGIAIKPVLVPLVHIITGPLFIPGGAVAGGLYMLFIVVAAGLTGKRWAATLTCVTQALLVIMTGVIGSHGIMSVATYILPGVVADLLLILMKNRAHNVVGCFFAGMAANLTGTALSNLVFFRLPFVPLMLTLFAGALSGALGGLIAHTIIKNLRSHDTALLTSKKKEEAE